MLAESQWEQNLAGLPGSSATLESGLLDAPQVLDKHQAGATVSELARQYGVSRLSISALRSRTSRRPDQAHTETSRLTRTAILEVILGAAAHCLQRLFFS